MRARSNDETYRRPHDADERIESAITVIEALRPLNIHKAMKRKFLSNCLWWITEAEGKNKRAIRFRSKAALEAEPKQLRHEHVYRRKEMVDRLIEQRGSVKDVVSRAVGCVVTKEEHERLTANDRKFPDIDRWSRYTKAKIVVIDMATGLKHEHD